MSPESYILERSAYFSKLAYIDIFGVFFKKQKK